MQFIRLRTWYLTEYKRSANYFIKQFIIFVGSFHLKILIRIDEEAATILTIQTKIM